MKTAVFFAALAIAAPALAQSGATKYKFSTDVQRQPVAQGMDLVDGAVVCPSMDEATWLFSWINKARHARRSLSPELRQQAALANGFDYGAEPRPSDYGCVLVPAGTPLDVEQRNYLPVVSGVLPNGKKFKGVTIPNMIAR